MAVTLIEGHTHEGIALGPVSGVDGYTAGGAGNDTLDVVASTELVGAQCLTWKLVAGADGACSFYENPMTARASGARWRFSFHVKALAALGASAVGWLSLSDAAFVEFVAPSTGLTTDGFRIGISGNGVTAMAVQVNDQASPSIAAPRTAVVSGGLLLNRDTMFVLEVAADDTYQLWCDQGTGRKDVTTGSLITGNVLIDRFTIWNAANTIVSDAIFYDDIFAVTPSSDTKRPIRGYTTYVGEITAVVESGDTVTMSIEVKDAQTAAVLWTKDESVPLSYFTGLPADESDKQADAAVTRVLKAYSAHRNVAGLTGHQLEL